MSNDTQRNVTFFIVASLIALGAWWYYFVLEWESKEINLGYGKQAKQNDYLAAQLFLESQHVSSEYSIHLNKLDNIKTPGEEFTEDDISFDDTIFVINGRGVFNGRRYDNIRRWVEEGGHLITTAENPFLGSADYHDSLFYELGIYFDEEEEGDLFSGFLGRGANYGEEYEEDIEEALQNESPEEEQEDNESLDLDYEIEEGEDGSETIVFHVTPEDIENADLEDVDLEIDPEEIQKLRERILEEDRKKRERNSVKKLNTNKEREARQLTRKAVQKNDEQEGVENVEDEENEENENSEKSQHKDEWRWVDSYRCEQKPSAELTLHDSREVLNVDIRWGRRFHHNVLSADWEALHYREDETDIVGASFLLGNGRVSVMSDAYFLENGVIQCHDHAYLLWRLVNPEGKVWFFENLDAPSLLSISLRYLPYASLAVLVTIIFAVWSWLTRFGPVFAIKKVERRSFAEHIRANAMFMWRKSQYLALINPLRRKVEKEMSRRVIGFDRLDKNEKLACLTKQVNIAPDYIEPALFKSNIETLNEFIEYVRTLKHIKDQL